MLKYDYRRDGELLKIYGSNEHYRAIAVCHTVHDAEKIVDALNLVQQCTVTVNDLFTIGAEDG